MQVFLLGGRISVEDMNLVDSTIVSAERMIPQLAKELSGVRRRDFDDDESYIRAKIMAIRQNMPSDELAAHNYERMVLNEAARTGSSAAHFTTIASLSTEDRRARRFNIHRSTGRD